MDYLSTRILKIAEDELPKHSWDLSLLGIEVLFGTFLIQHRDGTIQPMQTFALVIATRPAGPQGSVMLGHVEPVTNAHVFHTLYPAEAEVRASISTSCNALRDSLRQTASKPPTNLLPGPLNGRRVKDNPQA